METIQPAAPADGMTQDQLDDVYARILALQVTASRVLHRAARLRASMTELLGSSVSSAS